MIPLAMNLAAWFLLARILIEERRDMSYWHAGYLETINHAVREKRFLERRRRELDHPEQYTLTLKQWLREGRYNYTRPSQDRRG